MAPDGVALAAVGDLGGEGVGAALGVVDVLGVHEPDERHELGAERVHQLLAVVEHDILQRVLRIQKLVPRLVEVAGVGHRAPGQLGLKLPRLVPRSRIWMSSGLWFLCAFPWAVKLGRASAKAASYS